eukprot:scaffold51003_cov64-Phaeocystis_antarctica.AAC.1
MYGKVFAESNAMRRGIRRRDSPTCVGLNASPGAGLAPGFTLRRGASVWLPHAPQAQPWAAQCTWIHPGRTGLRLVGACGCPALSSL